MEGLLGGSATSGPSSVPFKQTVEIATPAANEKQLCLDYSNVSDEASLLDWAASRQRPVRPEYVPNAERLSRLVDWSQLVVGTF